MSDPRSALLTLKRQPVGAAVLVATLEDAWIQIRQQHLEVPAVQILVGHCSRQRGGPLLGYFAADRWQPAAHDDGELVHELVIAGEGLALGAEDVFTTLLHEAAHALAVARHVADTSRDGRYHNDRYRQLANQLGLDVARDPTSGWSITTLQPGTRARYVDAIDAIAAAITLHRLPEPTGSSRPGLGLAVCGCPRRIRVAPAVLEQGPISCALCDEAFTTPTADQGEEPTG